MNKLTPLKVVIESKSKFCSETGELKKEVKSFWIRDERDVPVSIFTNEYSMTEEEASSYAHLFAAAPEMYRALGIALETLQSIDGERLSTSDNNEMYDAQNTIEAVLKKARGES